MTRLMTGQVALHPASGGVESVARSGGLPPLAEPLIVGYGNDLRCDDAAGVFVARKVAAQWPQARVIVTQQLTLDLADDLAQRGQVVFVDAYAAQVPSDGLRIEKINQDAFGMLPTLGHRVSPAVVVHLARTLFGTQTEAWVLGVPAFCFAAGEKLSPQTQCRIDEAVALIGARAFSAV